MRVFALTGGIGSGKSAVAAYWRSLGLPVVDADQLARQAVTPGEPALTRIAAAFGPGVLNADGTLDRSALAARVFGDPEARARLNQLVHPEIRRLAQNRFAALGESGEPLTCYEVPLLFETGQAEAYRPVVLVSVSEAIQLERTLARDGGEANAVLARIKSQLPLATKAQQADYVIDNEGSLHETHVQARAVLRAVCRDTGVDASRYFEKPLGS
ncbi:MAG TPA: dephospho-CoA kinase [Polyangiaceae bacterium]|nr:dephospho-CoA kinase [Polyangiaceae bacterium]